MNNVFAYPIVGATGLCNMLYPWARAVVWARERGVRVIAPNFVQFKRLGVWLRWERDKRTYLNQFTNKGYVSGLKKIYLLHKLSIVSELVGKAKDANSLGDVIVGFQGREEWGWMESFKNEARFLREELERITNPKIVRLLSRLPKDFIGVHIRRGDFHHGDELLNDEYYIKAIKKAKNDIGCDIPTLIFSDADSVELKGILANVGNAVLMPSAPAIHDVLALSHASAIVGTNHSTFSYWAAFMSCGRPSYWSLKGHRAALPIDVCPLIYI